MTWSPGAAASQSWSGNSAAVQTWRTGSEFLPSSESRLTPVYPLPENSAGDIDFIHRIQSSGYFVVATGNAVRVESRITDGP